MLQPKKLEFILLGFYTIEHDKTVKGKLNDTWFSYIKASLSVLTIIFQPFLPL